MFHLRNIRRLGAILLLCAVFLPLSECSQSSPKTPPPFKTLAEAMFPQSGPVYTYEYAIKDILAGGWNGVLTFAAFCWPMAALFLGRKWWHARFVWIFRLAEVLLSAGTLYLLYVLTAFHDRLLYGAFVALFGVAAYAGTAAFSLFETTRTALGQRRQAAMPHPA